jgi:phage terminase small subunit
MGASRDIMIAHKNLNERQARFVAGVMRGEKIEDAYENAGYEEKGRNAEFGARTLLHRPAIVAAIHSEISRQLTVDARDARRVAVQMMNDPAVSDRVRADLAVKLLRLGGHVEPRSMPEETRHDKPLHEMTTEELRARAEQLEGEIASRARPISAKPVPSEPQVIDIMG